MWLLDPLIYPREKKPQDHMRKRENVKTWIHIKKRWSHLWSYIIHILLVRITCSCGFYTFLKYTLICKSLSTPPPFFCIVSIVICLAGRLLKNHHDDCLQFSTLWSLNLPRTITSELFIRICSPAAFLLKTLLLVVPFMTFDDPTMLTRTLSTFS